MVHRFHSVHFAYPFRSDVQALASRFSPCFGQVLKGVSFVVEAGTSAGLVGPSGGGKSTVMAMIQRFYDPASGAVLIGQEQRALNELNIRWWRKQVGFVGQEPILFDATVKENATWAQAWELRLQDPAPK